MTPRRVLKLADDGYATLLKIVDFFIINLVLTSIIESLGDNETAIDILAAFIFSVIFLLIGEYCGLYNYRTLRRIRASALRLIGTFFTSIIVMEVVKYFFKQLEGTSINNLNPEVFESWYLIAFILLIVARSLPAAIVRAYRNKMNQKQRIAIIGMTPAGIAASRAFLTEFHQDDIELAYYDDRGEKRFGYLTKIPYLGEVDNLIEKARRGEIDEVYIALPMVAKDRITHYLEQLSDTTVDTYIVPDLYTYNISISKVKAVNGVQTFSVFGSPFDGIGAAIKRIEDIIIGSIITLMISPVLLAVAVGVKMSSPGPVLFKQDRYGLGGRKIKVWKFRSMKVMENSEVVTQATKNDPRVTKFGAFIRRTSLDELPQFINVLQGSMSIVGPRPHAVAHNEQYRKIVDNYMIRHKIKPGITGWAQINGYRGETETVDKMEKRIQYDIQYMQDWTLWLDVKIIFLTIFKGFVSETAY